MKTLKFIGITILGFLAIIIFATALAITTLFTYFPLQSLLFGRGNYLLFVSSTINIIPVMMIMILIIYGLFQLKDKIFKKKGEISELTEEIDTVVDIDISDGNKLDLFLVKLFNKLLEFDNKIIKVFKVIKKCYILALIIAVYYGMTSYTILYSDSIKISSPIAPIGVTYSYSDIKSVNVGIEKYKESYTPYYKIILKNNKVVDLFGGSSLDSVNGNTEEILINLDSVLKKQGVQKTVDKSNFEKFSKGLNKSYVKETEKLFE